MVRAECGRQGHSVRLSEPTVIKRTLPTPRRLSGPRRKKNEHFVGLKDQTYNFVMIGEGEWRDFITSEPYKRKKEADKDCTFGTIDDIEEAGGLAGRADLGDDPVCRSGVAAAKARDADHRNV